MVEKTGLSGTCGEVRGVGKRGEFVSAASTGKNHAGNERRVETHCRTDCHERNTECCSYRPSRTDCNTYSSA